MDVVFPHNDTHTKAHLHTPTHTHRHPHTATEMPACGHVLRTVGEPGEGAGRFSYPYGVALLPGGRGYVVSEYLNHRLQVPLFVADRATVPMIGVVQWQDLLNFFLIK